MKNKTLKKSLAMFLSFLMVLSCLVTMVPEIALEAKAATYSSYDVTLDITLDVNGGGDVTVKYYEVDSNGNLSTSSQDYNFINSLSDYGDGRHTITQEVPGWPYAVVLDSNGGWLNYGNLSLHSIKVGTKTVLATDTQWSQGSGGERTFESGATYDGIATDWPTPAPSSVRTSMSDTSVNVPMTGSSTSNTLSVAFNDQYGVEWPVNPTYTLVTETGSYDATARGCSIIANGKSVQVKVDSDAEQLFEGTYGHNPSIGTTRLKLKATSGSATDEAIVTLNSPKSVTYENLFSFSDWTYSASSNINNSASSLTADAANGKITIYNGASSGEVTNTTSATATTRNTQYYAIPINGDTEYIIDYTRGEATLTNIYFFYFDKDGNATYDSAGTSFKETIELGTYDFITRVDSSEAKRYTQTIKTPDNAAYVEIRFDGNAPGKTYTFSNIALYPAQRETEVELSTWTSRPYSTQYNYGALITAPASPTRPGYTFENWYYDINRNGFVDAGDIASGNTLTDYINAGTPATAHYNLLSNWTINSYTVKFYNGDNTLLKQETVNYKSAATAPTTTPTKAYDNTNHYTFKSWDKDFSSITGNLDVYPTFNSIAHAKQYAVATVGAEATDGTITGAHKVTCSGCAWTTTENCTMTEDTAQYVAPGCSSTGKRVYECADCGNSYTKTLAATGNHVYGAWYDVDGTAHRHDCQTSGCTAYVQENHTYADNDWTYSDETNHKHYCTVCNLEGSKVQHTHSWDSGVVTTAPTCTVDGVRTYTCSECNGTKTEAVPATDHDWDDGAYASEDDKPTCTEGGTLTYTCGNANCPTKTYTEAVSATGHTAGTAVTEKEKPATCITAGSYDTVVYCTVCTLEVSRNTTTVPATGEHVYGNWTNYTATTHMGSCTKDSNCTATITEAHTASADAVNYDNTWHYYKCEKCDAYGADLNGAFREDFKEACFGEGTTFEQISGDDANHKETCKCGNVQNDAHSWTGWVADPENTTDNQGTMSNTCLECGYVKTSACTYEATETVPATCTEDGYKIWECSGCDNGYTETLEAPGHTEEALPAVAPTCEEDGLTAGVKCSACGEILTAQTPVSATGHSYGAWVSDGVEADGTGTHTKTCTVCSESDNYEGHTVTADHEWAFDKTITAPTWGVDGEDQYKCTACGATKTVATDAKVETVAPTGSIEWKANKWEAFLETVTFGLYAPEDVTLTITAADADSGVKSIEYYESAEALNLDEVKAITSWNTYVDGGYTVTAVDAKQFVVYAKITDNMGNVAYLNTDGITFDTTKPVVTVTGAGADSIYCSDVTVKVEEEHLLTFMLNNAPYSLGEDGEVTLSTGSYNIVVTDEAGNEAAVTFTVLGSHDYQKTDANSETNLASDATCTEATKYYKVCTRCGDVNKDDSDTYSVGNPLGHTAGTAVTENEVAATCTADGSYDTATYCTVCGAETSRENTIVPALGHNAPTTYVVTDKADCTTDGTKTAYCGRDNNGTACQEVVGTQTITARDHDMTDWVEVTAATCTTDGLKKKTCQNTEATEEYDACAHYVEEAIPAAGHDFTDETDKTSMVSDATCTTGTIYKVGCSACDAVSETETWEDNDAAGHEWEDGYCTICDTFCEHDNVTGATCVTPVTCDICGYGVYDFTNHVGEYKMFWLNDDQHCTQWECCGLGVVYYDHVYENYTKTSDATCLENAKETGYCECGGFDERDIENTALDHDIVIDKAVDPTCEGTGLTEGSHCSRCNYATVAQEEIPALGHTDGEAVIENEVAATCTEDGSYDTVVYCTVCSEKLSSETIPVSATGHTDGEAVIENEVAAICTEDGSYDTATYCTVCGEETSRENTVVPALGHTDGEAVVENEVAATCTEDGSYDTATYCTVCGEETSRENTVVPATGHTDGEAVVENEVAATCTEDGSYDTVVYCAVCGVELSSETTTVPATGHNYTSEITTAPTCTEEGVKTYTCQNANCPTKTYTETVDALGHTPLDAVEENRVEAKCGVPGSYDMVIYCDVCDEELLRTPYTIEALLHKLEIKEQNDGDCVTKGYIIYECVRDGCPHEVEQELSYGTTHVGNVEAGTRVTVRDAKKATCDEEGYTGDTYCECGVKLASGESIPVDENAHQWGTPAIQPSTCVVEGFTIAYCDDCGEAKRTVLELDPNAHMNIVTGVDTQPTCTEIGYTGAEVCEDCKTVITPGDPIKALGHNIGPWEIITMPSEDGATPGYAERWCLRCKGERESRSDFYYDQIHYVVFHNDNGVRLTAPRYYIEGDYALRPEKNPTKNEDDKYTYEFIGWDHPDKALNNVTKQMPVVAQYKAIEKSYTVTFYDGNGNVIPVEGIAGKEILFSDIAKAYTGSTPTKASTADYTYEFVGWNIECDYETGEASVVPEFRAIAIEKDDGNNDGIFGWLIRWIKSLLAKLGIVL